MARHLPHKKLGGRTVRKGVPVPRDGGDPALGKTRKVAPKPGAMEGFNDTLRQIGM